MGRQCTHPNHSQAGGLWFDPVASKTPLVREADQIPLLDSDLLDENRQ